MSIPLAAIPEATTAGGFLLVLLLVLPVLGVLAALVLGGRNARRVALLALPLGLVLTVMLGVELVQSGQKLVYVLGGWAPPLGIALRADGLSAVMLVTTVLILLAVAIYGHEDFRMPAGSGEARAPFMFWTLLLAVWGALNAVFLAGDLFNLVVGFEILLFASYVLLTLGGTGQRIRAGIVDQ